MSNIKECIQYVLDSEEVHYLEYVESEFEHLTQDDEDFDTQIKDIDWIKKNFKTINHIYMIARLAEEELK